MSSKLVSLFALFYSRIVESGVLVVCNLYFAISDCRCNVGRWGSQSILKCNFAVFYNFNLCDCE